MRYEFQTAHSGRSWVEDFLDSLSDKEAKKTYWLLKLLEVAPRREDIPSHYLKRVVHSDGIWEVRTSFSGTELRFLGFFHQNTFWINHAFKKKSQELKHQDIGLAEKRKKEFYESG